MDKTYSEVMGKAPFDWRLWLTNAIVKTPSKRELNHKTELASKWVTCACGNQCAIIPRYPKLDRCDPGRPVDKKLDSLGYAFYSAIFDEKFKEALDILGKIERRSKTLIRRELKKLNS